MKLDISELKLQDEISKSPVVLTGWSVIIDGALFIIPDVHGDDHKTPKKVKISNFDICYAIFDMLKSSGGLLGGGDSFLFHKAEVAGVFKDRELTVFAISLELNHQHFVQLDISLPLIEKMKEKHANNFVRQSSFEWLFD